MKIHPIAKAALTLSLLAAPCLAQAPRSAQDHFNRGGSHYKKGDFEGAIADFTKAIEISSRLDNRNWQGDAGFDGAPAINPRLHDAYNNRGIARYALKDYDRALVDFDRAIAIDPRNAEAYNNRGNVYMDKEDVDRALADFDRAIALDPRLKDVYFNRGFARREKKD